MATTTNYSWSTPDDTALVKDGASAIRTLGSSIDTTTKALNPSTTLGDIEYRSATSNTNTRLGIGTTNQVLSVVGGGPAWATAAAGGMTSIATGSLSGSAVAITSIPGTYKDLQLVLRNFQRSADGLCHVRFNGDSTARYGFTGTSGGGTFGSTEGRLTEDQDSAAGNGLVIADISDYANATTWKMLRSRAMTNDVTTNTNWTYIEYKTFYNQTGAITQVNLSVPTGTFTGGTYILYGVS